MYRELPPLKERDKTFIDGMVNDYVELICIQVASYKLLYDAEMAPPTQETAKTIDQCYIALNNTEEGLKMVRTLLKTTKIAY
jgi:hypothetical protein